jgi:ERCC4-type nuclease
MEIPHNIKISKRVLILGDIVLIRGDDDIPDVENPICIIERKSIADLLASIKDGRYAEQSHRLTHASGIPLHNIMYVIEGMMSQARDKQLVYSSMTSLNLFKGFSVIRTTSIHETAEFILGTAIKLEKEFAKGSVIYQSDNQSVPSYMTVVKKVKKENITPENIMGVMLCQIPNVSAVIASVIVAKYSSMKNLIECLDQDPKCMDDLKYNCNGKMKKVSSSAIRNIQMYMTSSSSSSSSTITV